MNELTRRVLFALVAAPAFLWVIWLGGYPFLIMMWLVCMLVQRELLLLLRLQNVLPKTIVVYTGSTAVFAIALFPGYGIMFLFAALVVTATTDIFSRADGRTFGLMGTFFALFYPATTLLAFVLVRQLDPDQAIGFGFILMLLMMVWGNDTFAYFGGKTFGKHAMAPRISPKKTWEGFFSGFIGAAVGLWLALLLWPMEAFDMLDFAALPILVSLFGPVGDLTISKIKRASGTKDTANILPGHGGFLDRFDSILLVSPVVYLYLTYAL